MLSLGMCTVWSIWFWHNVGNFKPITLLKAKLSKMGKYLKETKFSKIWTIQNSILDVFQLGCNIDAVYSFLDILTDLDFKKFCPKRSQKVGAAFFKKFGPKCRFASPESKNRRRKVFGGNGLRPKGVSLHQFWRLKIIGTLFRLNYFSGKIGRESFGPNFKNKKNWWENWT